MANRQVATRQDILDAAFALACEKGPANLSVRAVANACGVAVGTVYNSYPTKAALLGDVVERFWAEALRDIMLRAQRETDFVAFCRALAERADAALGEFRHEWLGVLASLGSAQLEEARAREAACFEHIERGLETALGNDPSIDAARLSGALAPRALCSFIWESMLASLRRGQRAETLLALIEGALRH